MAVGGADAGGSDGAADRAYAALTGRHADFDAAEVAAAAGLTPEEAEDGLRTLAAEGRAAALPDGRYVSDAAASRLTETARRAAAQFHRQNPLRRALPRETLRAPLEKAAAVRDFGAAVEWLIARGTLAREGRKGVRLPDHEVVLPEAWRVPADEIRAVYAAAGLRPPLPDNFQANYPRDVSVPGILGVLKESGELVDLGGGLYVGAAAVEEAKAVVRRLAGTAEGITVGAVRDATGSGRKMALAVLEYLDRTGFTKRVGDTRVLAEP